MKKIISFLLILLILCLFLVACNRNNNDTDTSKDTQSSVSPSTDLNKDTNTDTDTNIDTGIDTDNIESTPQTPEDAPILPDNPPSNETDPEDANRQKAPNFTMLDYNGNEVTLESFKGKTVVLNFWASWCPPCKAEMPDFDEVYKQYGNNVHFVMVNLPWRSETVQTAKDFYEQSGYSFPIYFDINNVCTDLYNVSGIPTTVIINKNGYIVTQGSGMISKDSLISILEALK